LKGIKPSFPLQKIRDFLLKDFPEMYPEMLHRLVFVNLPPLVKEQMSKEISALSE
jgi:hypothetical protein